MLQMTAYDAPIDKYKYPKMKIVKQEFSLGDQSVEEQFSENPNLKNVIKQLEARRKGMGIGEILEPKQKALPIQDSRTKKFKKPLNSHG